MNDTLRLGYDHWGVAHIPDEPAPIIHTEAMCAGPFSDDPLSVRVEMVPYGTPLTCLQCLVRFGAAWVAIARKEPL